MFENVLAFVQQIRLGVVMSNPPAIPFSYKFEFILCKYWGTSYKDIRILNC